MFLLSMLWSKSPKVVEKQPPIRRIIPISTWLITMVSSFPQKKALFSFQMTLWRINGGYLLTITHWNDAEITKPASAAQGGLTLRLALAASAWKIKNNFLDTYLDTHGRGKITNPKITNPKPTCLRIYIYKYISPPPNKNFITSLPKKTSDIHSRLESFC